MSKPKRKKREVCWSCGELRERCRPVTVYEGGTTEWYCPRCWTDFDMDHYISRQRGIEEG